MKKLDHIVLSKITKRALPRWAKCLCVVQDHRPGWKHLATVLALAVREAGRIEYVVWRVNLETPDVFSGDYRNDLESAWTGFSSGVKHRLAEPEEAPPVGKALLGL